MLLGLLRMIIELFDFFIRCGERFWQRGKEKQNQAFIALDSKETEIATVPWRCIPKHDEDFRPAWVRVPLNKNKRWTNKLIYNEWIENMLKDQLTPRYIRV